MYSTSRFIFPVLFNVSFNGRKNIYLHLLLITSYFRPCNYLPCTSASPSLVIHIGRPLSYKRSLMDRDSVLHRGISTLLTVSRRSAKISPAVFK